MRRTVRLYIVALVAASVAASFLLLGLVESRWVGRRLIREKQGELTRMVCLLARSAERHYGPDLIQNEFDAWSRTVAGLGDYRLSLISGDGRLIGDSHLSAGQPGAGADSRAGRPEVIEALKDGLGSSRRYSATEGRESIYVASRIVFGRSPDLPPMVLRLGAPMSMIEAWQSRLSKRFAVGALLVTMLAAAAAAMVTRPLDRDIKTLINAARDLADGNLARRLVRQPRNELAFLGVALNRLASRFSREAASNREDRDRLLAILENMGEGVLVTGADGRVNHSNPAFRRIFQLEHPPTGLPGEYLRYPELIEALARAGRGETLPPLTLSLGLGGRPVEVRLRPLGDEYEPDGVVAVFHQKDT
ncbi:MAG: hypothetical protein LBP33_08870 [Candidatus Adiutrix sp.]|jgi:two-component system phosphate regulon sensor histidine kinase PhoR|nr:hypothetical protein [Candidatus Adiutrix sp.]